MTNSGAEPIDDQDNPELTDRDIARMRPAREVLSAAAYAQLTGASEVTLEVPVATIRAFAEEGKDWRELMVATLTEAARKKPVT